MGTDSVETDGLEAFELIPTFFIDDTGNGDRVSAGVRLLEGTGEVIRWVTKTHEAWRPPADAFRRDGGRGDWTARTGLTERADGIAGENPASLFPVCRLLQ